MPTPVSLTTKYKKDFPSAGNEAEASVRGASGPAQDLCATQQAGCHQAGGQADQRGHGDQAPVVFRREIIEDAKHR